MATYYVDGASLGGACNDANPGTLVQPWCTIGKGMTTAVAGDTVYVREDTYAEGNLNPTNAGAAGNYITFQAFGGETPTVDANGFNRGFYIQQDYIEVNGFTVANADQYGIQYTGCTGGRILNNTVHTSFNNGIHISATALLSYVDGNTSYNNGQQVAPLGGSGHGILCFADSTIITNNVCRNNGSVATTLYASGIEINNADGCTVQYNTCHDNYFYGIDIAQPSTNTLVEYNDIYSNNYHGISVNTGATTTTVRLNLVYKNGRVAAYGGGLWIAASTNYIVRNTVVNNNGNTADSANISFPGAVGVYVNNEMCGNITWGHLLNRDLFARDVGRLAVSDYNDFYEVDNVVGGEIWVGAQYLTLNAYQVATGLDANSISQDPLFVDEPNDDYHIQAGSPCRDTALTCSGDYNGPHPDMGALEYVGTTIIPTPPTPPTAPTAPTRTTSGTYWSV